MNSTIAIFLFLSLLFFALSALKNWKKSSDKSLITQTEVAGFLLWQGVDRWGDYILYPVILGIYGMGTGALIMIGVTFILNTTYVIINSRTEADWTFMSWVTNLRDTSHYLWPYRYAKLAKKMWVGKRLRRSLVCLLAGVRRLMRENRIANPIIFIILSVWQDSFHAINFLYHKEADLRKPKVFCLYCISHIICNLSWLPVAGGMAVLGKVLWNSI